MWHMYRMISGGSASSPVGEAMMPPRRGGARINEALSRAMYR